MELFKQLTSDVYLGTLLNQGVAEVRKCYLMIDLQNPSLQNVLAV